mmetsp:Transcript_15064/g.43759  ORF Transcript_15064/g.43759 Transcript_15064/m.43759 type:complete len:212 (-) Transcript_15064:1664-2299(-)
MPPLANDIKSVPSFALLDYRVTPFVCCFFHCPRNHFHLFLVQSLEGLHFPQYLHDAPPLGLLCKDLAECMPVQRPQLSICLRDDGRSTGCGVHECKLAEARMRVPVTRTLIDMHNISTRPVLVFLPLRNNPDLELPMVHNVETVTNRALTNNPVTLLDINGLHDLENHLPLRVCHILEHDRSSDGFRNAGLLVLCFFSVELGEVEVFVRNI